jgi:hypothetical protein
MLCHAVPEAQQPDATTWVGGSRYHFRVFDREDELDYHFRPPAPPSPPTGLLRVCIYLADGTLCHANGLCLGLR